MDKEIVDAFAALTESLAPVIAFVSESKQSSVDTLQATVDTEALKVAVAEALTEYEKKNAVIEAADLLPSQVEALREAAKNGADIAPLVEAAKKILAEATASVGKGEFVRVGESATDENWQMAGTF